MFGSRSPNRYNDILYTLLSSNYIIAGEKDNVIYFLRELKYEYEKWGLTINFDKTEYLKEANKGKEDLNIDGRVVKGCKSFLASIATSSDINNKIGQGKRAIRQLNSVLWNEELTRNTKKKII